jgi:hypothetical protein
MAKVVFQIGDLIRNRTTREEGRIVRFYTDLLPGGRKLSAYVVTLSTTATCGAKEALWIESDVEATSDS